MPTASPRNAYKWTVAVLLFLLAGDVAAQDRYVRIARQHDRPRVFHEAVVLPGPDSAQAVVAFRVPNSLLVFVQQDDRFAARPEVTVELFRGGSKIGERIWRGEHGAPSFAATQDNARDVEGHVVFDLPPGRYAYELSLSDDVAGAIGAAKSTPFVVPEFRDERLGRPFFARLRAGSDAATRADLANLSGSVPFGEAVPALVPVASLEPDDRLAYRLYRIEAADDPRAADTDDEYVRSSGDELIAEGALSVDGATAVGRIDTGCTCWDAAGEGLGGEGLGRLISVDVGAASLENGSYLLEIEMTRADGGRRAAHAVFETFWRDMPLSLYDVEVAIRNLQFIESREQIRDMLRGSRDERMERFRAYWDGRDPTPDTPFNELMAEYYRRVDVAADRFRTGKVPYHDGLRSDAANVFIVHGPPDHVASSFPSDGGVVQVWTYPSGRQFVFQAASSLDALELQEERAAAPSSGGGS